MDDKTERIRALNDSLRRTGTGGKVHATRTVVESLGDRVLLLIKAVAEFADFNEDNDPHKEHDCAILEFEGERYLWKIDYYDLKEEFGSDDSSDPAVTVRVLTIMLAEEY